MRVRSLLKTLFIWTVLSLMATTCAIAQKLSIQDVTIDDTILPVECGAHGWVYYKGNGDHAFSPGERVKLFLTVKNQTGYQITSMSGTLFDYNDQINTYSFNCYSGGEGVPFSVPIENGAIGSLNGNFIVEITQDISCGGFVELGATFNYTTSQGSFSEAHYFSVPVFTLDTFVRTPDTSMVESSYDRQISALATSTRSIGMFYRQDALVSEPGDGEYFAELNLDGILTSGPTFISSDPHDDSQCTALWNATERAYQLLTPSPTADMQVISMGSSATTTQVYLPQGTANKISTSYYDTETFSADTIVLLAQGSMGQAYFCRRMASSPYNAADWMNGYQDAGYIELPRPNTSCMLYDSSIGYVPGLGAKPPYYFLAVEYHGGGSDVIRVYRINAASFYEFDINNGGGDDYYDITVGFDFTANPVGPSLVVDPTPVFNGTNFQRTVVLAFKNDNSANSILATIFSENLGPVCSNVQMTPHSGYPMDESDCPSLAFSCGRIYMVNRERSYSVGGFSYASRVQVGAYDPYHGSSGGVWTPVQSEYVSETWINQENLTCLGVLDKNYVFWDDSRGTALEPLFSIHYSEARCLDDAAPYNVSFLDDTIISQPFEYSLHPAIACREADDNPMYPRAADCMAVWQHSDDVGTTYDIYRTSLMPVVDPVDDWPQAITTGGPARSGAHPSVHVYNNDYKVFWMTPGSIWKYSYINSGSQPNGFEITTVTDTEGKLLDVSPVADNTDIVLLKDWRYPYGGENSYNLWAVQSFGNPLAVVEANLTQYPDGNVELLSGKMAYLDGLSVEGAGGPYFPFASVAWLEKQNTYPQETRMKFGYLYQYCDQGEPWECHLGFVPGYPVTLQAWSLGTNPVDVYDFSMSANNYVAGILVSYKYSSNNDAKLALFNYQHPVGYSGLTLSPSTLPDAIIGSNYSQNLSANGTSPIYYSITSGILPQGLFLTPYGAITGNPTISGTYEFTATATDAVGRSGQRIYSITVGYSGAAFSSPGRSESAGSVEENSSRSELIGFMENGAAIMREMTYASGNPFKFPRLKANGTYFDFSWVEEGASYGSCGGERLFFTGRLDQFGCPMAWPVRVVSPLNDCYTEPRSEANYQVASTNSGTVGVYFQGAGQMASNIYATALSWDEGSTDCSLYNQAPVITAIGGPYTINYGEGVTLTGSAFDDTALGDYIALAGWDITGDGTADFSFLGPNPDLTLSLTSQQLRQKGVDTPRDASYPVSLKVTDRRGLTDTQSTSVKIQDTTPPVVNLTFPDGGETLRVGGVYTILWSASDNYQLNSVDLYYCTDWGAETPNWIKINPSAIPVSQSSYDWTVPDSLSSTCRVKVVATDKGVPAALTTEDPSEDNFYIVQATTSSIKTLILRSQARLSTNYNPEREDLVDQKLLQLIVNGKVEGFIVELDSIPGLSALYATWDGEPTSVTKANAVAEA
ncbi:MAG TPA: putative Ig domain-containing protein, partial [Acidobacteriota bacterium]|nr:putative Ig domain-containing protein [Acidobacteriota bacterium]